MASPPPTPHYMQYFWTTARNFLSPHFRWSNVLIFYWYLFVKLYLFFCHYYMAQVHMKHWILNIVWSTLDTVHCTLHTAHCTVHTAHTTLHTAHCTLHTVHCILHTVHCTLHTLHCTLHTAYWLLYITHCTLIMSNLELYIVLLKRLNAVCNQC